jgi:hypothetical protein
MLFFTEILHLLVETTYLYYQKYLNEQDGPIRLLPDITLPDMMTFDDFHCLSSADGTRIEIRTTWLLV